MKKVLYMSFLAVSAIVFGGFISSLIGETPGLGWLSYSKTFAFEPGTFLDFDFLRLTFGVSLTVSIAQILLMIAAIVVYYNTAPKLFAGGGGK